MTAELLSRITELPVDDIEMGDRLRPVSDAGVEALMASIRELGHMKDPIHVRKMPKKLAKARLMAGGHRLTAARRLGWETIKVTAWRCNDDFARLMEIDDNLAGAELTPLDTAVFLAERKRVYEKLHPEAKHGGARGNQHTGGWQTDTMSFCQVTSEKFGMSDRHVRRLVRAGEALRGAELQDLRRAPNPVRVVDLIAFSKISDPHDRFGVIDLMARGEVKGASDALKRVKAARGEGTSPMNNTDKCFMRLMDAWGRAPKEARRRFLEERGQEVQKHLDEIGGEE